LDGLAAVFVIAAIAVVVVAVKKENVKFLALLFLMSFML
jgi:hypothetical protein